MSEIINSSSDWVDPYCVYLQFDLLNNEASGSKRIRPISNGHSFFRRLRVMAGNSVLEDINGYNKVAELFDNVMKTDHERENDDVEGFGYHHGDGITADPNTTDGVATGIRKTVSFRPLCGILRQPKYLCLRYMASLTFEFELVNSATDVVLAAGTNTSTNWQIENPMIQADLCQIDNAL